MNRGFLYGDGFFETMRIVENQIPLVSFHLARARKSAQLLQMDWPEALNETLLTKMAQQAPGNIMRIDFFRAGAGQYQPESNALDYHISFRDFTDASNAFLTDVADFRNVDKRLAQLDSTPIAVYKDFYKPILPIYSIKTSSALFYVEAGLKLKREKEADDYLLLNHKLNIAEGLSSNILIKDQGKWLCAHPNDGGVQGVYQEFLKSVLDVNEVPLTEERIRQADAAYLVNSIRGFKKVHLI